MHQGTAQQEAALQLDLRNDPLASSKPIAWHKACSWRRQATSIEGSHANTSGQAAWPSASGAGLTLKTIPYAAVAMPSIRKSQDHPCSPAQHQTLGCPLHKLSRHSDCGKVD